ncbi:MAG: 4'-phosphopantetheinyl transferase family protein [Acidimicrobiales bacterium]
MIEVWYLAARSWDPAEFRDRVGPEEADRARRFRSSEDAGRFLASRALLRASVGRAVGRDPRAVRFDRRCPRCGHPHHGAPQLVTTDGGPAPVHASLCRAGGVVAVAIGPAPLALDAEQPGKGVLDVVEGGCFTAAERVWVGAAPDDARAGRALDLWVAKEAIGKLAGLGLMAAERIQVPNTAGVGGHSRACLATDADGRACRLWWIDIPGTGAAAVATYDQRAAAPVVRPFAFT